MKLTMKLWALFFGILMWGAVVYAQSPREELKQMVGQLQQTPNDNALREKIIKLATSIKPAPAIPEEAREPFVMGATVLKKASDPAGASKAVDFFTRALNIAPWFADAYYNRAIAREAAGQFDPAIDDLKLYLGFKLTDAERREAQDKIYSLKADAQLTATKKAELEKAAESARKKAKTLIVPGVGIGEVQLGMLESQVITAIGAPSRRGSHEDFGGLLYFGSLDVVLSLDGKVIYVDTKLRDFVTNEGVGVGSSKAEISAAMGSPNNVAKWQMNYNRRGVIFIFSDPESPSKANVVRVVEPW